MAETLTIKTKAERSSNAILYVIARNKQVDELPITLMKHKFARGNEIKKGLYVPATDMIYQYSVSRNEYVRNNPAFAFQTVRQWGLKVSGKAQTKQFSAKGKVYVYGRTLKWHEYQGIAKPVQFLQKTRDLTNQSTGAGQQIDAMPDGFRINAPVPPPDMHYLSTMDHTAIAPKKEKPDQAFISRMQPDDLARYMQADRSKKLHMLRERIVSEANSIDFFATARALSAEGMRVEQDE